MILKNHLEMIIISHCFFFGKLKALWKLLDKYIFDSQVRLHDKFLNRWC